MADRLNLRTPTGYDGAPGTVHKMGIVRLATEAQAIAGTDNAKAITPATLAAAIAGGLSPTFGTMTLNGNLVLNTAGNKVVYTNLATTTAAGANSAGTVTLVGGTATISTTAVTAGSKIKLTRQSVGATGAAALGQLSIGTITAGASFVINAWSQANATVLAATDVSSIYWEIIN